MEKEMIMSVWEGWSPAIGMIVVDVAFGVMNVLVKKTLDEGLNPFVLTTIRQLVATSFMGPIAYVKERKTRPKLTWFVGFQLFSSAAFGSIFQYLLCIGLRYTSATFSCAFLNMAPVITFLVALPFGLETLKPKTTAGKAKILATMISIAGALVLMFYKGMALTNTSSGFQSSPAPIVVDNHKKSLMNWTIGSICLFISILSYSGWFLIQAKISRSYPAVYSSTTIMCFLSFLQVGTVTWITERNVSSWILRGKLQTLTVLYAGIIGSGFCFLVMAWCVGKRGPVFTVAFNPLIQVVVAIIDYFWNHEPFHLGSVLGSLLVIFGLYVLLWGKNKERQSFEDKSVQQKEAELEVVGRNESSV